ncbi:MAG: ABC transporter ATP-binding protein [Paramuribaculum sp.]
MTLTNSTATPNTSSPGSVVLSATGLETGYRSGRHTKVVAGPLDLSLPSSAVTCLLGPNGIGKSTLLRTLACELKPLAGCIRDGQGRNLSEASLRDVARMISVVFTSATNAGGLTAAEVVALGRQPYTGFFGRLSDDDRRIVEQSLEAVGIAPLGPRYMATLSDGERQKVMIARALAQQTPVMILDEPTSFLDVASRLEVMDLLRRLASEFSTAVLLSTHDVADALAISDRLWLLAPGGVFTEGAADEVVASGAMDSLFPGRGIAFDAEVLDYRLRRRSHDGNTAMPASK